MKIKRNLNNEHVMAHKRVTRDRKVPRHQARTAFASESSRVKFVTASRDGNPAVLHLLDIRRSRRSRCSKHPQGSTNHPCLPNCLALS